MIRALPTGRNRLQIAVLALLAVGCLCCAPGWGSEPDLSAGDAAVTFSLSPDPSSAEVTAVDTVPVRTQGVLQQMPDRYQYPHAAAADWGWHVLPEGLIYRSYLAGPKESRLGAGVVRIPDDSWLWDATIGGRVGILRLGDSDRIRPRGYQFDVEASAQVRLDLPEDVDVRGTDYRVGFPLTWGNEWIQWKFSYYHMSSHLGDEFLFKNEGFPVFGQARDTLVFGHSLYLTDALRIYGEAGWAFYCNGSEPWEFQFGLDYAPRVATGIHGAPFFAVNGYLREELDWGGQLTAQAGWAWRADTTAHLFRIGLQYYNGASWQYAFLPYHEQQIGLWAWYDF
jgi:hypothetical protein